MEFVTERLNEAAAEVERVAATVDIPEPTRRRRVSIRRPWASRTT